MSYGIWRKRGQGWCSIEIDSPAVDDCDKNTLRSYKEECKQARKIGSYWMLIRSLERHQILDLAGHDGSDDIHYIRWVLNQTRKQPQRSIAWTWPGAGEHIRWIAFDDEDALNEARGINFVDTPEFPNNSQYLPESMDEYDSCFVLRGPVGETQ